MTKNPLEPRRLRDIAAEHPEVDFALVLARTIDAIQADPEQLRGAIYDLARQKLREQFTDEDAQEVARLTSALEVAIQGVEAHSKKDNSLRPIARLAPHEAAGIESLSHAQRPAVRMIDESISGPLVEVEKGWQGPNPAEISKRRNLFLGPLRFVLVAVIAIGVVAAIILKPRYFSTEKTSAPAVGGQEAVVSGSVSSGSPVASLPPPEPPKPNPLIPTTYGVYAVNAGKLYELDPLPFRAPDIRVAVSAVITAPSRTTLENGHLRFVVFRRDAANNAPEAPDVRIVAKVEQAVAFDASGKPVTSKAEENWVVRNFSFPYRTAPLKDNPEMYELQSKDPDLELTPGRYVLVIKGQAFDFAVAGTVTDSQQCLQRLAAANGTFYSECEK